MLKKKILNYGSFVPDLIGGLPLEPTCGKKHILTLLWISIQIVEPGVRGKPEGSISRALARNPTSAFFKAFVGERTTVLQPRLTEIHPHPGYRQSRQHEESYVQMAYLFGIVRLA